MKIKVMTAQIETKTGDLDGNTERIISGIHKAIKQKVDIVVFPETAITGYCAGSLFNDLTFVKKSHEYMMKVVENVPENLVVILGNIKQQKLTFDNFPVLYNSAFVIQNHKIIGQSNKMTLANAGHHEDRKYFKPGNDLADYIFIVKIKDEHVTIGVPICEDIWNDDIINELVLNYGADIVLVPNQSFFHYGKQYERHNLVWKYSADFYIPIVYTNSIGVGDIVKNIMIFDGGSFIYNEGKLISQSPNFKESFDTAIVETNPTCKRTSFEYKPNDKYKEIFNALVFAQKKVFDEVGLKKAQVHLSGGIDSALVATIVVSAMGWKNTVFITNPTNFNSKETLDLAHRLAKNLGVKLYTDNMWVTSENLRVSHLAAFGKQPSAIAYGSGQAILRTAAGVMASHHFNSGIVATGNHTEIVLGWSTFHDIGSIGVHALIGDLTKVEVFELSEWINKYRGFEIIPKELYDGTVQPHAELGDNDGDPFDYYVVSGIAALMIRDRKSPNEIIKLYEKDKLPKEYFPRDVNYESEDFQLIVWDVFNRMKKSVYKAAQGAPIVIVSPRSRGFSNRETIFNHYKGR